MSVAGLPPAALHAAPANATCPGPSPRLVNCTLFGPGQEVRGDHSRTCPPVRAM